MKSICLSILLLSATTLFAQDYNDLPVPSKKQLDWHDTEYYIFMHFGPNTFTGKEWGEGTEPEDIFNPAQLDCRQWCRIAKESGAKAIIITAKHHDGFCLWPSKYSKHTVRESKWKNGKGDVLKELSQACREYGLKFGVYLSPWDRNHPDYGTPKYNDVFVNMMKEIFQNYGPVWEMWWDGANGEGPNGKRQVYDWKRFENTVKQYSPKTVIFSDIGPDVRWVGNENGIAGNPNWNFLDTVGFKRGLGAPPTDTLNRGNYWGKAGMGAECDVSIRPGWFWRESENEKVKSPQQLFDIYLKSVGRGANLLLNVPPDPRGLIHPSDSLALTGFKKLREESFAENLLKTANTFYQFSRKELPEEKITLRSMDKENQSYTVNLQNFIVEMAQPTKINCIILREAIHLGQTIRSFRIVMNNGKKVVKEISGSSVGRKRILTFKPATITSFTVYLEDAKGMDNVINVTAYLMDEKLIEK
ncbi:MAG: alpha-L-fucosidase [Chitinophagaceae bacterium]|nr:alpha-L-fucosidase [Chitinophagaceae bacterium]